MARVIAGSGTVWTAVITSSGATGSGTVVSQVWDRVLAAQAPPPSSVVLATAAAAFLLVALPALWPVSRHVITIAHEGAHGVAALLSGRRLSGIRLHSDTSGVTVSRGRTHGPGMIATAFAGYPGPALIGLGAAGLLAAGHAVAVLWLALVLLVLLLLQIRNFFGLWSVLVTGVAVFAISWWGEPRVQSAAAYLLTWFLLIAAPRPVLELQAGRRRGRRSDSDADQLARLTRLPGLFWVGVVLVVTLGCLLAGAALLARGTLTPH